MNNHRDSYLSESTQAANHYQKEIWPSSTLLAPVPVVMVTTQIPGGKPNICTVAWTGIVCSNPPMLSISVQPTRHSHAHLMQQKEFVVNVPPRHLARETDMCGVISGRDVDKFEKTHLTPVPAKEVLPPLIRECPVNLECRVTQVIEFGSHHLFIADIVCVHVQRKLINESGRLALEKARLLSYAHGHYYAIGVRIGRYGFSVRKRRTDESAVNRKNNSKKKIKHESAHYYQRPKETEQNQDDAVTGSEERQPGRSDRDNSGFHEHSKLSRQNRRGYLLRRDSHGGHNQPAEQPVVDEGPVHGEARPRRPRQYHDRTMTHDRPRKARYHDDGPRDYDCPNSPSKEEHHPRRASSGDSRMPYRVEHRGRDRARKRLRKRVNDGVRRHELR